MNAIVEIRADHKSIYAALAAAQLEMGRVEKDAKNDAFKRDGKALAYATLASVIEACLPALNRNGIAVFQPTVDEDGARWVKTIFAHVSGETIECRVPLIFGKSDMQGFGSAVTYARRYGLMTMAGVAPEDDDGNAAAQGKPEQRSETRKQDQKPQYDPTEDIAAIEACTTGKDLLATIKGRKMDHSHPDVAIARVETLRRLVKGAQKIEAITAFANSFGPDWAAVQDDAEARRAELIAEAQEAAKETSQYDDTGYLGSPA